MTVLDLVVAVVAAVTSGLDLAFLQERTGLDRREGLLALEAADSCDLLLGNLIYLEIVLLSPQR